MNERDQHLFQNSIPLEELAEEEVVDLAGYQVTKAELFAHSREPAITIWQNRMKFSMACLRRFPHRISGGSRLYTSDSSLRWLLQSAFC